MSVVHPFPQQGLLPKGETGAASFVATHPQCDGRRVTVAIFDTGCDPGASGLQLTSDGRPKFVDFIDATGSGDVDTSAEAEAKAGEDGCARFTSPLSARELIIPAALAKCNPSGRWRVGVKRAYELYPTPLVERMKRERRKVFDEQQRKLEHMLVARLARFDEDAKKKEKSSSSSSPQQSASPTGSDEAAVSPSAAPSMRSPSPYPSTRNPKDKADLEARLAEVRAVSAKYEDAGPVWDVLVWHDGSTATAASTDDAEAGSDERERGWFCAVDSSGTGDFTGARALTNYAHGGGYATFGGVDLMNFTVNIYSSGRVVSLVTTAGSHGTHVAGIVAAYEGGPGGLGADHNGIAPGAQLVSIKIGDSRLGSMETGVGLARGLIEAIRLRVDCINMSYGEASSIPNSGRISELIRSAVFDHGIVFVSSAGNNGPALSTAGSPGGTDTGVISVAAYVSPAMSLACYSSRRAIKESLYSWSSRGPTLDGALGASVAACGGAVTSVCEWQLQKTQLMNGTSMSSPACAGGVALLLSGLRARGLRWTPQRIKHAIENTARPLAGVEKLGQGHGILQIEAAFEHLVQHATQSEFDLLYKVSLAGSGARGVYLRDAADTARAFEASVQVEPVFKEQRIDAPAPGADGEEEAKDSAESSPSSPTGSLSPSGSPPAGLANPANYRLNKSKVGFQLKVALVCDAAWVDAPSHMILMHGGRTFSMVVHGETLAPGLHFTELLGYDAALNAEERVAQGPLFRVPITCCKPESAAVAHSALVAAAVQAGGAGDLIGPPGTAYKFNNLSYDSARIHRRFVVVPEGASYADFTIRMHSLEAGAAPAPGDGSSSGGSDAETSRSFMFHALYVQPEQSYSAHECSSFFTLGVETSQKELRMDVRPGQTLEVCLAQYWSSLGACSADVEVSFNGILIDGAPNGELVLDATAPFHQVSFRSALRTTKIAPAASLKTWCSPLRPQSATIVQLSRERDMIANGTRLISALNLTYSFELKEDSSAVKMRAPALNERLYESVYESQMTLIFDANKRFCFATDAFESGKALKAGKYSARIQVRHDDLALLERLKDMSVVVESALAKDISLPIYASYSTAAVGGAKFGGGKSIKAGRAGVLYVGVESKPFPAFARPGDWGLGSLVIAKAEGGASGKGGEIPLRVYSHPAAAPAASAPGAAKKPAGEKSEKPAEGEQDPAFPKLEQKDPAGSPTPSADPTASPATGGGAAAATNGAASSSSSSASSSSPSSLATELRDLTIEHLNKLKKEGDTAKKLEALTSVVPALLSQYPSHLPLLFLELRLLHEVNQSRARGSSERDDAAVAAKAQALLSQHIDQTALLAHFGRASPIEKDDAPAQAVRKEKEEIRKFVVKAIALQLDMAASELRSFVAQMRAVEYDPVARLALGDAQSDSAADGSASDAAFALSLANYHTLLAEAANWVDLNAKEQKKTFGPLRSLATKIARHYGTLWKTINADVATAATMNDSELQIALVQEKIQLLRALAHREPLYQHIVKYEEDWKIVRFPKEYQLF